VHGAYVILFHTTVIRDGQNYRQTEKQIDGQTDRPADEHTKRPTNRVTARQPATQADSHTYR